ncbi:MAG: hypothetical protein IJD97_06495 [Clostridia bacterium]|nr:hypothetical protein [Clostridia bacterium]
MAIKITNLPTKAKSALKDIIKSDGTLKNEKEAFFALSDYLILSEEPSAVYDIANFVARNDRALSGEIAKRSFIKLSEDEEFSIHKRRNTLVESLTDCAKGRKELNFEGFLTFRTEKYIRLLYNAVYKAAEEVFLEQEYMEMTALLRESVRETKSLIREAHIYGCFIFDEGGNEITSEKGLYLVKPDRMLEKLLNLAPERIYIHYPPEGEMLSAIEEVFSPNVIYIN